MAYGTSTLRDSFNNAKYNQAYYSIFFAEAEKFFRTVVPATPQINKIYKAAENLFSSYYDFSDLVQDCLLKLWECVVELRLVHPEGITTYLVSCARFVMLDFIKKESNRRRIAITADFSEAENSPYFDNFDEEVELTEVAEDYKIYEPGNKVEEETVIQVEKKTYRKIAEFSTIGEAAKATGTDKYNISSVLSGKRKTAGGYIWIKSTNPLSGLLKTEDRNV